MEVIRYADDDFHCTGYRGWSPVIGCDCATALPDSSTTSSSGSKQVWCATKSAAMWLYDSDCKSRNGKAFVSHSQAKVEHKRLKAASSSSYSTASSSSKIWCATKNAVSRTSRYSCNLYRGKVFDSQSQAKAEHKRLKPALTTSVDSFVWCVDVQTVISQPKSNLALKL